MQIADSRVVDKCPEHVNNSQNLHVAQHHVWPRPAEPEKPGTHSVQHWDYAWHRSAEPEKPGTHSVQHPGHMWQGKAGTPMPGTCVVQAVGHSPGHGLLPLNSVRRAGTWLEARSPHLPDQTGLKGDVCATMGGAVSQGAAAAKGGKRTQKSAEPAVSLPREKAEQPNPSLGTALAQGLEHQQHLHSGTGLKCQMSRPHG
jgi:hypothetical protein